MKLLLRNSFLFVFIAALTVGCSCSSDKADETSVAPPEPDVFAYGYKLNNLEVVRDTVQSGDTFADIFLENGFSYTDIYNINRKVKKTYNFRKIKPKRPYTFLFSKDSLSSPVAFIYQPSMLDYVVVNLKDSVYAKKNKKEVTLRTFEAQGVITSSLSETLEAQKLSPLLAYDLSDIYAWSIDFFRLEKGDRFKIVYTQKYVDDSIYVGLNRIHAAYFEHRKKPYYAIEFESDAARGITEFFDEKGKNLRRAFLQAPVQFSRISSRYNKRRRISYYGRTKPHYGTDFAAPVGTPIRATASGTVVASGYTRGNGNYVTIRHNGTYKTQYLHMKKRKVRKGQQVKQGDLIGTVGMTGYTSGPHVCYRFWKNGKQVDPFRQKLPEAKPIEPKLKEKYMVYMQPLKETLDCITFYNSETSITYVTPENQSNVN
ncbi:MAG: peptidoglycan DD-metalloendopeptidase family protein [Flavobacteriaceae bacterium]|nr:peptidoglycan DD-metalloendopeptidase family protein [Flavobacteriaceae bacterium]